MTAIRHGVGVLLLALLLSPDAAAQKRPAVRGRIDRMCRVARVVDGDTFVCRDGDRVRLLLVDAPERSQRPYGGRATATLRQLLPAGSVVGLELDVQKHDRYGRVLAYVYRNGNFVNRQLLRDGMALVVVYPPNVKYIEVLRAAADSARIERRGLWSTDAFKCTPVDHKKGNC